MKRRQFLVAAAALGASVAWGRRRTAPSSNTAVERRDLYPQGVASGDPDASSVLLWTRYPCSGRSRARLKVEVSEDASFDRVVATANARVLAAADWTCRVLVGNLESATVYWYRFVDRDGNASRTGRTLTAPDDRDGRPVSFAFVSCQSINLGALHAYRRMIFEDARLAPADRLGFVLHLGDFIYELVWYPEDNPRGVWGRQPRDILRFPQGERISDSLGTYHIPVTLEDYRTLYRVYLRDPDLQDARARWPFICIWDNHEFSGLGWQSFLSWGPLDRPAQTRKVAANQAWFEYQPARVHKSSGPSLETFDPPTVRDMPVPTFDDQGVGDEPNNRAAIDSLTGYRSLRWGRHVDLILTEHYSHRSRDPARRPEAQVFKSDDFPQLFPQDVLEILDAGREYAGGKPPATISFGDRTVANFRSGEPSQTLLGSAQKTWFLDRLKRSQSTWKIWGCSLGTLEYRVDAQNLPTGLTRRWPGAGYATFANRDFSAAYRERAQIYDFIRDQRITGFASVSGDRHSFWAGLAARGLSGDDFDPVGVAFVTGSVSMPGYSEMIEHDLPVDHPLRGLYTLARSPGSQAEATVNLLLRHGVRSALEYNRSGDIDKAKSLSNAELSPHLSFVDCGGHGYSIVRATGAALECEFICIPRPIERVTASDGGPIVYRVAHRVAPWLPGEKPLLEPRVIAGNPFLSL